MASKIDPNVYALSVQLQMDAGAAFASLDKFGDNIDNVEEQLSTAVDRSLKAIAQIADNSAKAVADLSKSFVTVDVTSAKVESTLKDATKEITDQYDVGKDSLAQNKKLLELKEDSFKNHEKINESLEKDVEFHDLIEHKLLAINDAIKRKNDGHRLQNELLENDEDLLTNIGALLDKNNGRVEKNVLTWAAVAATMRAIWGLIKSADADTERFVTTNFRLYGSQQQIVQGVRQLTMEHGLFAEQAMEVYQALGNLRVPRDQIDGLAVSIARAHRYTGASIQSLATFSQRMTVAGRNAQDVERQMVWVSNAMRRFGLNSEDVTRILGDTSISVQDLMGTFGGAPQTLEQFNQLRLTLAGVARSAGLSTESAGNFANMLARGGIELAKFESLAGMSISTMDDMNMAQIRAGRSIDEQITQLENLRNTGAITATDFAINMDALARVYYNGDRQAMQLSRRVGQLANNLNLTGDSAAELDQIMQHLSNEAIDPFSEANQTLTAQLRILGSYISSFISSVLQPLADALFWVVRALNYFLSGVATVIRWVSALIGWLEQIPVLGSVITFFKNAVVVILGLVVAIIAVTAALVSLSAILPGFGALLRGALNLVGTIGQAIVQLAQAIGQAISAILSGIGQGLAALGRAVQPVIGPLIGLAFALLLTAAAAWILAQAVKVIAEVGWAAVPALIGLVVAVGILGLVLVGLATLVQGPIALGLIILAAAFLAVGLAALMVGAGLYLAGLGIAAIAGVLSLQFILLFTLFGLALMGLALMAMVAGPGLYLLGAALMVVGVAAMITALAFAAIAAVMPQINAEAIITMATAFLQASGILLLAAANLALAGVLMLVGGVTLLVGAAALMVGILLLAMVSLVLGMIGPAFQVGAAALLNAAAAIHMAGPFLQVGAAAMLAAATDIGLAAILMAGAAVLVVVAGMGFVGGAGLLVLGALAMVAAAGLLGVAGVALAGVAIGLNLAFYLLGGAATTLQGMGAAVFAGGTMMLLGAERLRAAAVIIGTAGTILSASIASVALLAPQLLAFAGVLAISAGGIMVAAYALSVAGMLLVPAAIAIFTGLLWLEYGITRFSGTVDQISRIAGALSQLVSAFMSLGGIPLGSIARQLGTGVSEFEAPVDHLAAILDRLGEAISSFGEGLTLSDHLAVITNTLSQYAGLLEGVSDRIETAVTARAVPAMKAAEQGGIEEAVKSEAISTVKVMDTTEASDTNDGLLDTSQAIVAVLTQILDKLAVISGGGGNELREIADMLASHLPEMVSKDQGLSTQMNGWMK